MALGRSMSYRPSAQLSNNFDLSGLALGSFTSKGEGSVLLAPTPSISAATGGGVLQSGTSIGSSGGGAGGGGGGLTKSGSIRPAHRGGGLATNSSVGPALLKSRSILSPAPQPAARHTLYPQQGR
ncbi:hypothetical protein MNEG_12595 [Monoraphidium neglectum]|uniref:Uncharacterized protein n=1 Tax=Monoraphidium neglectum TaxID=145388 RepID=A0A0D2M1N2_9CHLO|nr:hypothetical protein MNEG_12595 [Monoraphidium neglectum]KIY95366.1 hypothetical protein MNEG_12595 [Monoraphidium neglectum]|eukprot:XP_013894386.1 hypothetical protein MNEG_12595 [Monoraphidium neglectum]